MRNVRYENLLATPDEHMKRILPHTVEKGKRGEENEFVVMVYGFLVFMVPISWWFFCFSLFETHPDVQQVFMPFSGIELEELKQSKQLRAHALR